MPNRKNDSRFLASWGPRLAELGLDIRDVNVGRYVQIDLSNPRPEPEEFAEFGEFDTFVVLNPQVIPKGCEIWVYFNNKRPESRLPLHHISRVETVADRFYLQHNGSWEGVTLEIILGGDLRALSIEPNDKGVIRVEGNELDITDRPDRELGHVTAEVSGEIKVTGGATEETLDAVRALLESLEGKDFATENTLSTLAGKDFATDAKLEAVRVILASLESKDFATESTLSTLASKDFATDGKLEAIRVILANLESKDFATENTLSTIANTLTTILAELQTQTGLLQQIADNTAREDG